MYQASAKGALPGHPVGLHSTGPCDAALGAAGPSPAGVGAAAGVGQSESPPPSVSPLDCGKPPSHHIWRQRDELHVRCSDSGCADCGGKAGGRDTWGSGRAVSLGKRRHLLPLSISFRATWPVRWVLTRWGSRWGWGAGSEWGRVKGADWFCSFEDAHPTQGLVGGGPCPQRALGLASAARTAGVGAQRRLKSREWKARSAQGWGPDPPGRGRREPRKGGPRGQPAVTLRCVRSLEHEGGRWRRWGDGSQVRGRGQEASRPCRDKGSVRAQPTGLQVPGGTRGENCKWVTG